MGCFIEDFRMRVARSNRINSAGQTLTWWNPARSDTSPNHIGQASGRFPNYQFWMMALAFPLSPIWALGDIRPPFWLQPGCMGANPTGRWAMTEDGEGVGLFGDFVSQPVRICGRYLMLFGRLTPFFVRGNLHQNWLGDGTTVFAKVNHQWSTFSYTLFQVYERIWVFPKSWGVPPNHPVIRFFLYWNQCFLGSTIRLRNPHIARLPSEPLVSVIKHGNGTPPIRRLCPYLKFIKFGDFPLPSVITGGYPVPGSNSTWLSMFFSANYWFTGLVKGRIYRKPRFLPCFYLDFTPKSRAFRAFFLLFLSKKKPSAQARIPPRPVKQSLNPANFKPGPQGSPPRRLPRGGWFLPQFVSSVGFGSRFTGVYGIEWYR